MRQSTLSLIGGVFVLLMIGLVFSSMGSSLFPFSRQVSNPEASAIDLTNNQGTMLILLSVFVLGGIGVMAGGLGSMVWLLNRQVVAVQQETNQAQLSEGDGQGTLVPKLLTQNPLILVVGLGVGMLALLLVVILVF